MAAIRLLGDKSVDGIVARLWPAELEQAIKVVGWFPSGYLPGVYAALSTRGIWHRLAM